MRAWALGAILLAVLPLQPQVGSATAVSYRFTVPEPQHHWMAVDASFPDLDPAPLRLRMSRSSPGRYALHEFAKNVYDVRASGPEGNELPIVHDDVNGWTVTSHGATVTVRYKIFGDRVDGTYLAIDPTHAHINMPAAVMWARGLEDRPVRITIEPPPGAKWEVASQLFPGIRPFEFAAPNLQYLMDSPAEVGPIALRQFAQDGRTFRFAAHHTGTTAELDGFVRDVERIVRAEREVFGEFPEYEQGTYTFLADYLPYASSDGMEHRNSTVITSQSAIRSNRAGLLGTVAHEFFHGWNVERIRPRSLEPFDFERTNMSGELWLAEGFTQYYGPLAMSRAGVANLADTLSEFSDLVLSVLQRPGRTFRSAEEMSRMAPFTDGGRPLDRTNWSNTVTSYYPLGGAIALALDLTLRDRYDGRVTLDHFMRAMWRVHGKPSAPRPGYVAHPYTAPDAEQRLAEVTGDPAFASDFFARFIRGREAADYARLLGRGGIVLRRVYPGAAWWGDPQLQAGDGLRIAATPDASSPAYRAGLDVDDRIELFDGTRPATPDQILALVRRHKPGDSIVVEYRDRTGEAKTTRVILAEDPRLELAPVESAGGTVSAAQRAFRVAWLGNAR